MNDSRIYAVLGLLAGVVGLLLIGILELGGTLDLGWNENWFLEDQ